MSAKPNRRSILALFGAGSAAAAASGASPVGLAFGRLHPGIAGRRFAGAAEHLAPVVERALPLDPQIPATLVRLTLGLESDAGAVPTRMAAEARAVAALALVFPPAIATPRSFGPPMRQRLYAELLARESERLASLSEPPPTPPASPEPGA